MQCLADDDTAGLTDMEGKSQNMLYKMKYLGIFRTAVLNKIKPNVPKNVPHVC